MTSSQRYRLRLARQSLHLDRVLRHQLVAFRGRIHTNALISGTFLRLLAASLQRQSCRFDVMLQTHSSPRRVAASSPLTDVPQSRNAVTGRFLQLHTESCSYRYRPSGVSSGPRQVPKVSYQQYHLDDAVMAGTSGISRDHAGTSR
jgi:hypothetical protein